MPLFTRLSEDELPSGSTDLPESLSCPRHPPPHHCHCFCCCTCLPPHCSSHPAAIISPRSLPSLSLPLSPLPPSPPPVRCSSTATSLTCCSPRGPPSSASCTARPSTGWRRAPRVRGRGGGRGRGRWREARHRGWMLEGKGERGASGEQGHAYKQPPIFQVCSTFVDWASGHQAVTNNHWSRRAPR